MAKLGINYPDKIGVEEPVQDLGAVPPWPQRRTATACDVDVAIFYLCIVFQTVLVVF